MDRYTGNTLIIRAHAKINWSLDIVGKRADGYHLLDMVSQTVDLHDRVHFKRAKGFTLTCDRKDVPTDERNIVHKAVRLFCERYAVEEGVAIHIEKRIPMQAGMAGGSTDAAAALEGLYLLYDIEASHEEKAELAVRLGADVPFMLKGGLARIRGIGEDIDILQGGQRYCLVILKPRQGASTKEIFSRVKLENIAHRPNNEQLIRGLISGDRTEISANTVNVLQPITEGMVPEVADCVEALHAAGAFAVAMTGSGSAVYGAFTDEEKAQRVCEKYSEIYEAFLTYSGMQGLEIEKE